MSGFNMQKFFLVNQGYAIDPVCEMKVDPNNPRFQVFYKGRTYYFCSEVCKHLFERVPDQYIRMEKDSE